MTAHDVSETTSFYSEKSATYLSEGLCAVIDRAYSYLDLDKILLKHGNAPTTGLGLLHVSRLLCDCLYA